MVFNEVVAWRGSTMLLLNHKASYVCKLLYFKIIHQCTYICGCEISEWKACQTITNGFTFYKKEKPKVTRLWVFALHDLVE